MLNFLKSLFMPPPASGALAKERLRLVLLSDHLSLAPDVVEALKRDLLEVISRYVEIDTENADVTFEHREREVAMLASIPITGVRERRIAEGSAEDVPPSGRDPAASAAQTASSAGDSDAAAPAEAGSSSEAASPPEPQAAAAEAHSPSAEPNTAAAEPHTASAPPAAAAESPAEAAETPAASAPADLHPPALEAASPKEAEAGQRTAAQRRRRRKKARTLVAQSLGNPAQA